MGKAGNRLIRAADEAAQLARQDVDACMLQSMASAFRSGLYRRLGFSFNDQDMADLLERVSADLIINKTEGE